MCINICVHVCVHICNTGRILAYIGNYPIPHACVCTWATKGLSTDSEKKEGGVVRIFREIKYKEKREFKREKIRVLVLEERERVFGYEICGVGGGKKERGSSLL